MDRAKGPSVTPPIRLIGPPGPLLDAVAGALGFPPGDVVVGAHADGERHVAIREDLWGVTAVLLASTGPPVDEHTLALALLADAARRAGARAIVAVIPYLGYSRGDRIAEAGAPVACRTVANLLQACGVSHVVAVDLHNPAITGFFDIPVLEVSAVPLLAARFTGSDRRVVVAPDAGAIGRASRVAEILAAPLAIAVKRRTSTGAPKVLELLGDVGGRDALIVDDMVSTGGTVREVGRLIRERGGRALDLAATHAVMAPGAEQVLRDLALRHVVLTDTLPFAPPLAWPEFATVSVAGTLAAAIRQCAGPGS